MRNNKSPKILEKIVPTKENSEGNEMNQLQIQIQRSYNTENITTQKQKDYSRSTVAQVELHMIQYITVYVS